ncbi:Sensor_kinase_SpoOB-type, alpha-helical domain [Amphibacillus marinus]|uniref:Sensor_kinase_SpoOB-type, alpha-helical domain n=1 Tax=Amphibacillus marinus TaxID=872970 RepID=A0A1H8P1F8_9BACI|nr:Spo0B domain-containing protein [Amphibacillus marinus]SEO35739.1 Sensor_kinase_SpoOB-type, alpha-helical domain [Amphibacillus marinus]
MNHEEVVKLVRHYRHDWSNHLQLIMGYAQMGNLARVQENVAEFADLLVQEQALQSMPIPQTIVTLMQLQHQQDAIQLRTEVDCIGHPKVTDERLSAMITAIYTVLLQQAVTLTTYHVTMKFHQETDKSFQLLVDVNPPIEQLEESVKKIDRQISIKKSVNKHLELCWTAE